MRNLKSISIVSTGNLLKPELEGYQNTDFPTIHSEKKPQVFKRLKEISKRLKAVSNIKGRIKFALGVLYFTSLVYFLTILLI